MSRRSLFALILSGVVLALASVGSAAPKKLKVYILAGQSNMQGHAHVRTIEAMKLNKDAAPLYPLIRNADGSDKVNPRVRVSAIGSSDGEKVGPLTTGFGPEKGGPKFGPELLFGMTVAESYDGPILIIKTAWGGKSLYADFRPPSAGPYAFNENQLEQFKKQNKDIEAERAKMAEVSGHYYRLMMDHVKKVLADPGRVHPDYDAGAGYELAGFVWFQGWNDMVNGGVYPNRGQPGSYGQYSTLMAQFIREVRKDLDAPKMPFVIGVMGAGGPVKDYGPRQKRYAGIHQEFRDAMAAPAKLPEFKGNVVAVLTENFWDGEVTRLRERAQDLKPDIAKIQQRRKDGEIDRDQERDAILDLHKKHFTPRELTILNESTSNAEYHYLGSGGIMARIGHGFAEATMGLQKK